MKASMAPAREEVLETLSWRARKVSWKAIKVFPLRFGLLLLLASFLPPTDAQLGDWETTSLCIHDSSC